ncbi:MAG: class I SAM-dependent methyltransferase [Bacteroidota bacterium]
MSNIELFENQRASGYDQFVETWIPNYHYFMDIAPKLLKNIQNNSLLVAGCGTGNEIKRFVRDNKNWKITGIDPSPEMLSQAIDSLKTYKTVNLIEGVVADLDKTEKFGAATLLLVLHFIEDNGAKKELLKDIADRLESNAPFILLDITGDKEQIKGNLEILKALLPQGLNEDDLHERLKRIEHKLHAVSEERLTELLTNAGFNKPLRFFQNSIYMGWITQKK